MRHPRTLLTQFESVGSGDNVTYVLSPDRRLSRYNAAWARFALANGGGSILSEWSVGCDVLSAVGPWLRAYYAEAFSRACAIGAPWEHEYECSSPQVFRRFKMIAYPYLDWLLVTHSLVIETPHDRPVHAVDEGYDDQGMVVMCSHCRRTRHATHYDRWDWVPSLVERPPSRVSHGLCVACYCYYYDLEN